MMGVSRATIRSAIQRLATEGLVETINGDGTYIKEVQNIRLLVNVEQIRTEEILEILEFRTAIEMLSSSLAAKKATPTQITKLGKIVEDMKVAVDSNDKASYSLADMKYYTYIAEVSGNSLVLSSVKMFSDHLFQHFVEMNENSDLRYGLDHHIQIYEAIAEGDSEKASNLARENIDKSIYNVKSHYTIHD